MMLCKMQWDLISAQMDIRHFCRTKETLMTQCLTMQILYTQEAPRLLGWWSIFWPWAHCKRHFRIIWNDSKKLIWIYYMLLFLMLDHSRESKCPYLFFLKRLWCCLSRWLIRIFNGTSISWAAASGWCHHERHYGYLDFAKRLSIVEAQTSCNW